MRSIGSISELAISSRENIDRKGKQKLSEQLREEKERLFGLPNKRKIKRILPKSKKTKWDLIYFESPDECEGSFNLILSQFRKQYKENIFLNHLKYPRSNRDRHVRMIVCYITSQCFFVRQKEITEYFGMHRDIIGTANRMLVTMFENQPEEQQKFFDFFDYFMTLMNREYL